MAVSIARNISRWSLLHPCNNGGRIPLPRAQQHNSPYTLLTSQLSKKPSNSKLSPQFCFEHCYSTSSPSSGGGFLKWYLGLLETRPFLIKSVSTSLIYCAADITSQMLTLKPSESYDTLRTLRIAGYGLLIMGPSQHIWFTNLSRILPGRDVLTTVKKIFMGQVVYGPIINSIFFSYNAALRGETKEEIVARLKRDLLPTLRSGVMYWPLCDFLTFRFIPVHLQPLANSSFAYLWTIYLTYMASLKKVGED